MSSNWAQLKYLLKHKFYVAKFLIKHGLWFQAISHDISKFHPIEWAGLRGWYFEGKRDDLAREKLNFALLHHYKFNKHHWQNWVLTDWNGERIVLQMPDKYVIEMICDWRSASLTKTGVDNSKEWYKQNKDKILLHPITRMRVEYLINENS